MKNSTCTYQKSYSLKHYRVERNTEAVSQECFIKKKCSKKCPGNSHIQRLRENSFVEPEVERETTSFSLWIIWRSSEQFRFDKVTFKRATFPLSCRKKKKLKSRIFTLLWVLILALFPSPIYLEWTKASLRTDFHRTPGNSCI